MKVSVFIVIFSVLLVGCSNPKDTVIPQLDKLKNIKPAIEKLTPEDKQLLSDYLVRHTIEAAMRGVKTDPIPNGITIAKAIAEEQELQAMKKQGKSLKKD